MRKKTKEDYRNANPHYFTWIETELPKDTNKTVLWKCKNGHTVKASYSNISRGMGCRKCNIDVIKKGIGDYHSLASKKKLLWVGDLPDDTHSNTTWECLNCGSLFESSYNYVLSNTPMCTLCSIRKRAKAQSRNRSDYIQLAESRGLVWIDDVIPKDNKEKTLWECLTCKHVWRTCYNTIDTYHGCPECAKERVAKDRRKKEKDYQSIGLKFGYLWIGCVLPRNSRQKTEWKCEKCGNEWRSTYADIRSGYGCPTCANMINGKLASKSQVKLAERIGGEINYRVNNIWIDVAIPERKIAIEYDSWYWHCDRVEQDRNRAIALINLGWKVLSIKSNLKIPNKEHLYSFISCLSPDAPYKEMVLSDWGNGVTHLILN